MRFTLLILFIAVQIFRTNAQEYLDSWESLDKRPIPTWFEDAKFGIFIHWGVYSVPAWRKLEQGKYASYAEWYYARVMDNKANGGYEFHRNNYGEKFEYRDFAPMFTAELFNPDFWAETFKNSGAKYVVLTAKHHDGYCLWPTENSHKVNWNSGDIGPKRDLLGDLTKSVREQGLKMGIYYSIPDWESVPRKLDGTYFIDKKYVEKYGMNPEKYSKEVCQPQLKELVKKYKPSLIFSDAGEWTYDENFWQTKEFLSWLYNESPSKEDVVVNDRFCKGMPGQHGDYFSSEYEDTDAILSNKQWEESRGIGGSYGFNRAENLEDYQSSKELLHELISIVSRGGNLLLNIGPTADGRIPVVMQERLQNIGEWLDVNGEAIYGTRKSTITEQEKINQETYFTTKNKELFCIFTKWTDIIEINLDNKKNIKNISILGFKKSIKWELSENNKLKVQIPKLTINELPCLHAWSLKIEFEK